MTKAWPGFASELADSILVARRHGIRLVDPRNIFEDANKKADFEWVEVFPGILMEFSIGLVEHTRREIIPRVADLAGVTKSIDDRLGNGGSFYQTILFSVCTFDIVTDIPLPTSNNRRRGRPRGTVGNRQLQKLVEMLWEGVKLHGGNLYADHKRDDGGTMLRALELLRPITPKGLLPKTLPVPTIETIIKNFKASGRTWFKVTPK